MSLRGGKELKARLRAIKVAFKPIGRDWADDVVELMKPHIPEKTGKTKRTVRRRNATMKRATVVGSHVNYFLSSGTVAHPIAARRAPRLVFTAGGRTIFAKRIQHPRTTALRYRERAAHEALRRRPMAAGLIKEWNRVA
jgi:hypothetical protein